MPAYALCVWFAAPSAFALARRMNAVEGGIAFAAVYFSAVAAAAIVGCVVVSVLARRVIIAAMTIFLALAVCMGVLHVVGSSPAERWFRVIKVLVFLATSAAAFLTALAWQEHRRCRSAST
jgi:hypothetical protein